MNLLSPKEDVKYNQLYEPAWNDLGIDALIDMITSLDINKQIIRKVFNSIPTDTETIIYRQEIFRDLFDDPDMCRDMKAVLENLDVLLEYDSHKQFGLIKKSSIWDLISYMEEMDVYVKVIEGLNALFGKYEVKSAGLNEVKKRVENATTTDDLDDIKEVIARLKVDLSQVKSVTMTINLSTDMFPEGVVIHNFNNFQYNPNYTSRAQGHFDMRSRADQTVMRYLTQDLEKELAKELRRTKKAFKEYLSLDGFFLLDLIDDLRYYLLMVDFATGLSSKGNRICIPKIVTDNGSLTIKNLYNIRLTEDKDINIIKNDFAFKEDERLFILTGPNRGGKTILSQAVGLSLLMAAQGLFVTADSYEGFVFDQIFTHFPADEQETLGYGRLGEEAIRIKNIVKNADDHSLLLLNETYSSTYSTDGAYLAEDLIRLLKNKNIPMIYNTHLLELAHKTDLMDKWEGISKVVSITMELKDNVNTFRLLRDVPDDNSHARNIATMYGITYEQMLEDTDQSEEK
ncbi:MAG: hypothetical protein K6G69_00395 [Lachnospiraceae bacterium]|nr:hypothetical protein [Lachnospiraceae bacterium]